MAADRHLVRNVMVDGTLYTAGTVPPADVADQITSDSWSGPAQPADQGPDQSGTSTGDQVLGQPGTGGPDQDSDQSGAGSQDQSGAGPAPEPPPHSGAGSGLDAWRDYAAALGVQVAEHAKRSEVIDAIRDAGHPVGA